MSNSESKNTEKIIEIKDIRKTYQLYNRPVDRLKEAMSIRHKSYHADHFALDRINLDVYRGECVGIIGTNGSGKSTLLKIVTGVLNPTEGEIKVHGKISALLELGTGFNPEYTGRENIFLSGTMNGISREDMAKKVDDIIEFAEIGDFIDQPVKTYSSGMFARLGFAVAINVDPEILIVDEALSVGDIFFQSKCFRKFTEFKEQGKTIIFVSHDMGSIIKYCDRTLLIHKGKQIKVGKSSEIVDIYRKILVNQFDESELDETGEGKTGQEASSQSVFKKSLDNDGKPWHESVMTNPNFVDYGSSAAKIIDYCVLDNEGRINSMIYKGTECTIRMKIRFESDVSNPIFAFTIKDVKGTDLTGTNTMLEDNLCGPKKAGDEVVVDFVQKMDLQGGNYLISFGCTGYEADDFVVYHRLYDMINLQILSDLNTIGVFDTNTVVTYPN